MILGALLTSAEGEGVSSRSDWSRWIDRGRAPESGGGNGFASNVSDDLGLLRALGATEVAVTAEWSRLQPAPREHDHLEIERLRATLDTAIDLGLQPWLCLVDGTLPGWFADDEGGFGDDRARSLLWPRHVDFVGETFGDLVAGWIPQREPIRRVLRAGLLGLAPPGRLERPAVAKAVRAAILADGEAWRLLRGSSPVALSVTGRSFHPEPENVKATPHASWLDEVSWQARRRVLTDGELSVAGLPTDRVDHLRDGFDQLIVHLRRPIQTDGDGRWTAFDAPLTEAHGESAERARDLAGQRSLVIAGDVDSVSTSNDEQERADDLQAVVEELGAERWWQSSPIDGWHWENGFSSMPGVFDRDRAPRKTADLLRRMRHES